VMVLVEVTALGTLRMVISNIFNFPHLAVGF
nr:RhPI-8h=Rhesus blood group antigen isoform {C-terminal, alternatively spliced} [human, reticulocytes, Peptide Partial, 30 aa] [Homo sapiens]